MRAPMVCWAVTSALVLTSCATQESDPESASSTPPALEASPSSSPEESALEAYRGMWDVVAEGAREGAVGHPDLSDYASGQALELTTDMLQGVTATGEPELAPEVVDTELEDSPSTVSIEDCVDSSDWLVIEDGETTEVGERRRLVSAEVVRAEERWLVDDLWLEDYGSC